VEREIPDIEDRLKTLIETHRGLIQGNSALQM
jgi:hypothetical protein